MSVLVERSMGGLNQEDRPAMFPLFQKGPKLQPQLQQATEPQLSRTPDNPPDAEKKKGAPGRPSKKAKPAEAARLVVEGTNSTTTISNGPSHTELLDVDPNNGRRKRRKTASLNGKRDPADPDLPDTKSSVKEFPGRKLKGSNDTPASAHNDNASRMQVVIGSPRDKKIISSDLQLPPRVVGVALEGNVRDPMPIASPQIGTASFQSCIPTSHDTVDTAHPAAAIENKPKKLLRFNPKTGTIGSPPAKKLEPPSEHVLPKRSSGRSKQAVSPKSKVVKIHYDPGTLPTSIGERIDAILAGIQRTTARPAIIQSTTTKPPKPIAAKSTKPLHPLFMGKSAVKESSPRNQTKDVTEIIDLTETKDAGTHSRARPRLQDRPPSPRKALAPFSGFGSSTKTVKFPGAVEPAWPWHGMVHVRGLDPNPEIQEGNSSPLPSKSRVRKSKYQAVGVLAAEDILESLAAELSIKDVVNSLRENNPDEYPLPPHCLRVPVKHYESGLSIQRRARKEVQTRFGTVKAVVESSSEDELQLDDKTKARIHPALAKVYDSIAATTSAFDKGQCEPHTWNHKYSPKTAAQVLQPGREALILKEWLETLTVKSVEVGGGKGVSSKPEVVAKRKRKPKKLDDFVVSTDEEENNMDEITEPEDNAPSGSQGQVKRTVIKAKDAAVLGSKDSKVSNAVVMSGPHGCGKTAAVYAVAKELGFEVFEINSGSRRSGKDIMEKVGDMTRNHLVQRSVMPAQLDGVDEDKERIDNALADDIKSGRQGTMNSFFKSTPTTKPNSNAPARPLVKKPSKEKLASKPSVVTDAINIFSKLPARRQKQSLILVEEADILYKEDSQFWITIMTLISTSKRPIILTCTDESVLPMDNLSLYAIIRMVAPPLDLAVDYMLLVAACEGHIIKRDAVKCLYETRGADLRGSLADLNFWCQFAVGDVKSGLDWYYPRSHAKENETIRVVSEGTYKSGMGCLSQDHLESQMHHPDLEEHILHDVCDQWQLDLGDWEQNIDMSSWAGNVQKLSNGKTDDRAALNMFADFAESMSVADLCSGGTFAPDNQIALDVSIPELPPKARDDYILAYELLEAPTLATYSTLSKDISLFLKSRTRKYLHIDAHLAHNLEISPSLAPPSKSTILSLLRTRATTSPSHLTRVDLSLAFDPISTNEKYVWSASSMEASTFDRTMTLIVEDMAPYVRSIVAYDARLQQERLKLSNLISEGGKRVKRMRTTRAAMSALEGGTRKTTRKERYFTAQLNPVSVLKTGMQSWTEAAVREMENLERVVWGESRRGSKGSTEEGSGTDEIMDSS